MDFRIRATDRFYDYFQREDRSPKKLVALPLWLIGPFISAERLQGIRLRIETLSFDTDWDVPENLPPIELLMVVAEKDFPILPHAVESALKNSLNEIAKVVIVTQNQVLEEVREIVSAIVQNRELLIIDEDDLLDADIRKQLKVSLRNRYGWALQQFLCLAYTQQSQAEGVLILDADTLLVRPRAFIGDGKQILMPTLEHHHPYYEFLHQLDPLYENTSHTFVSHHMLWQPLFLRQILDRICNQDLHLLALAAISNSILSDESPFCVKYELYGQALWKLNPEAVQLCKWSNLGIQRPAKLPETFLRDITKTYRAYASISLHDYI